MYQRTIVVYVERPKAVVTSHLTNLEIIKALQKFITTMLMMPTKIMIENVIRAPESSSVGVKPVENAATIPANIPTVAKIHGKSVTKNAFLADPVACLMKS